MIVTISPRFLNAKLMIWVAGTLRLSASSLTVMNSLTRTVFRSRSASALRSASISSRDAPSSRKRPERRAVPPRSADIVREMFAVTAS